MVFWRAWTHPGYGTVRAEKTVLTVGFAPCRWEGFYATLCRKRYTRRNPIALTPWISAAFAAVIYPA